MRMEPNVNGSMRIAMASWMSRLSRLPDLYYQTRLSTRRFGVHVPSAPLAGMGDPDGSRQVQRPLPTGSSLGLNGLLHRPLAVGTRRLELDELNRPRREEEQGDDDAHPRDE